MKKDSIYVVTLIGIILDQMIKFIIRGQMELFQTISVIPNFFAITYIQNRGAAWGIFQDATIFLIFISFLFFYFLLKYIQEEKDWNWIKTISFGMLLSGVIGNLFDRILYHGVTDYLDFHIFGYSFPIFNLADIFIVVGVFLLIILWMRSEINGIRCRKGKRSN